MPPDRLGPYQIAGILGRGGMGAVYRAVNEQTQETAAIKILSASLAEDPDFRQRFEAEIETLRKLRHPNIVRLFGFGEEAGVLFYAMELVDGHTLEQELRAGQRFKWPEVARIGLEMCWALRHAHDRGVVHRDIKPANLLLAVGGQVKLSDFGIARLYGYSRLTAIGNVLGTIDYMAPEQAYAQPTGPQADLYSLGGVLYTLLARRPPFRAKSLPEMLELQRSATAEPVSRYAPDVPIEFERLIFRLLEKKPEKRFATAMVLARHLESILRQQSPSQADAASENPDDPASDHDDFDLSSPEVLRVPSDPGEMPATREIVVAGGEPPKPNLLEGSSGDLPETKATSALANLGSTLDPDDETEPAQKTPSRFIRVDEEELDQFEPHKPARGALISPQTWVLVIGLILIGLITWYFLQDPSADALYRKIVTRTADGTIASYRRAEEDIDRFLELYSDDSRSDELRTYLSAVELDRLENKFELRAKGLVDAGRLLPIDCDYLEAIKYVRLDPERGMVKLEALIDLYDRHGDDSGPTGQRLILAKRRLASLRNQLDQLVEDRVALVHVQLDMADEAAATDPDRARRKREAVIELYDGKPWADEVVKRARAALDETADSR